MTPSIPSPLEPSIEEVLQTQIQTIALTLRGDSLDHYRVAARRFLRYLREAFPEVQHLSQLRRDPHMLGWFRWLAEGRPLGKKSRAEYYIALRRLLRDCQHLGYEVASDLILSHDIPPVPRCLPRALSLEDDGLLDQELRRRDNLLANALRLMRATGMRIGECIDLSLDCVRHFGDNQWALHVPIGKLYTERLVPVDEEVRQLVARILSLRALRPLSELAHSEGLLLPRRGTRKAFYKVLRTELVQAGQQAGCTQPISPHRLRHTYASEMIRLGVSLPAVMQLLGHKDIRMTMRYLQVTQNDLQYEFRQARHNALQHHDVPQLAAPQNLSLATADLPGIRLSITATRHLLEMYRRQLHSEPVRRCLQRLDKRLLTIDSELERLVDEQE
jgi:site-specific recombinase XerD